MHACSFCFSTACCPSADAWMLRSSVMAAARYAGLICKYAACQMRHPATWSAMIFNPMMLGEAPGSIRIPHPRGPATVAPTTSIWAVFFKSSHGFRLSRCPYCVKTSPKQKPTAVGTDLATNGFDLTHLAVLTITCFTGRCAARERSPNPFILVKCERRRNGGSEAWGCSAGKQ